MKRQRQTELPRFIVGALATAGASAANGATVQITVLNNYVSVSTGLSNFMPDLTGDGAGDVMAFNGSYGSIAMVFDAGPGQLLGMAAGNAVWLGGVYGPSSPYRALVGFTFSDYRINGNAQTNGFLDMTATGGANERIQIHRLIFNNENTTAPTGVTTATTGLEEWMPSGGGTSAVPEASTSLGLLALGAGGILTRRRQKRAA